MRDYYSDIPIGESNSIPRVVLAKRWGLSERRTRQIIQDLRNQDNGDGYVIVSKANGWGYYRTDDPDIIAGFIRDTQGRADNTLLPLRKAKRIMRERSQQTQTEVGSVVCKLHDFRDGYITQSKLVKAMQKRFPGFDRVALSKAENGLIILPPDMLAEVARLLGTTPQSIYPSMLSEYRSIMEDC